MTQQENLPPHNQALSSKLSLPQGTAESATIDVSDICEVRVVKSGARWTIQISLKSGPVVNVPYSHQNVNVLEKYVTASYPDGRPENGHVDPAPGLDLIDDGQDPAAEMVQTEVVQTDKVASTKQHIKSEEFSKLAATVKAKELIIPPGKIVKKKKLG